MNTKFNKKNCKKSHIMIVAALILSAIFTTSCATTINLRVTRPAQVNSFGAESIAILPFGTEGSRRLSKRNGKKIPVIDFFIDMATNEGEQKDIANYMRTELEADFARSPYLTLIDSSRVLESLKNGNDSPADIYLTGDIISLSSKDKTFDRQITCTVYINTYLMLSQHMFCYFYQRLLNCTKNRNIFFQINKINKVIF